MLLGPRHEPDRLDARLLLPARLVLGALGLQRLRLGPLLGLLALPGPGLAPPDRRLPLLAGRGRPVWRPGGPPGAGRLRARLRPLLGPLRLLPGPLDGLLRPVPAAGGARGRRQLGLGPGPRQARQSDALGVLGLLWVGGATCLRLLVSYGLTCFMRCLLCVKDHHTLQTCSPRLKKTCVRQVSLDKRFPLNSCSPITGSLRWRRPRVFGYIYIYIYT